MADETKTADTGTNQQPQPKLAGKYDTEEALYQGVAELAKTIGVPVGKFENAQQAEEAYKGLSDTARRLREAAKPTQKTVLENAEEPSSVEDVWKKSGVDIRTFFGQEELDDELVNKVASVIETSAKSPKTRKELVASLHQLGRGRTQDSAELLRLRTMVKHGINEQQMADLLQRRNEILDPTVSVVVNRMLTAPTDNNEPTAAFDLLMAQAKAKGVIGSQQQEAKPLTGNVPNNGSALEVSQEEYNKIWQASASGNKAAQARIAAGLKIRK